MMGDEEPWQRYARCTELSISDVDAMFFPGSGGKPSKAQNFCSSCPVQGLCLSDAIVNRLVGFFSGTTDADRRTMKAMHKDIITRMEMPPEPTPADRVLKPMGRVVTITHLWMDYVEPTDEELRELEMTG